MLATKAMKVTTLRISRDLWALLDGEARRMGVSVSQYIREAALARAAAAAGARGEDPLELLAGAARGLADHARSPGERAELEDAIGAITRARDAREGARALQAESRQAQTQASTRRKRATQLAGGNEDETADG